MTSGGEHKILLAGIDAPKRKQPFGQRAKQRLSDLVYGKTVELERNKQDRYKRQTRRTQFQRTQLLR